MSEQSNGPASPPAGTGGPADAPGKSSGGGAKDAGLGIAGDAAKAKAGGATNSEVISGAAKQGVQKVAETGVKKATGSDIAVDALHSAQKVKNGDVVGGAQNLAASGANAATTAAVGATGVGAPVATLAGSTVGSVVNSKLGRYAIIGILVGALVAGGAVVGGATLLAAGTVGVISAVIGEDVTSASVCSDSSIPSSGPGQVVGSDIEEKVWNYLRGAGYTEEQTAGVMGNIKRESQFNPWAAENASTAPAVGKGWGLVQWTADRHASVRDAVIAELGDDFYVGAPSIATLPSEMSEDDVDTMVLFQMRYIIRELETNEQAAGRHLASTTTVEEATRSFESKYERAGVTAIDERIANAKAYFEQYSGSPVPDSGGTDPGEAGAEPAEAPPAAPADVSDSVGSASNSGCSGTSIAPGGGVGAVIPCPDGDAGCVNIAALTKPSSSLTCPDGTTDGGTTTAYYKGNGVPIRLCAPSGVTDIGGRPVLMNATIAPAFLAFYNEAQSAGLDLSFTSSYRSHASQQSIYARSPGNAARPGWSNHEFGMAFDVAGFSASYNRNNCGSTQTPENACSYPGSGAELERWKKLREIGLKHGMYIHDQEFWHIEFIPSGTHRDRNIPVYEG